MATSVEDPVVLIRAPSVAETKGAKSDAHRENAASPSAAAPPVDVKQHQAQAAAMKLQQVMKAYGAPPSAARSNHSRAGNRAKSAAPNRMATTPDPAGPVHVPAAVLNVDSSNSNSAVAPSSNGVVAPQAGSVVDSAATVDSSSPAITVSVDNTAATDTTTVPSSAEKKPSHSLARPVDPRQRTASRIVTLSGLESDRANQLLPHADAILHALSGGTMTVFSTLPQPPKGPKPSGPSQAHRVTKPTVAAVHSTAPSHHDGSSGGDTTHSDHAAAGASSAASDREALVAPVPTKMSSLPPLRAVPPLRMPSGAATANRLSRPRPHSAMPSPSSSSSAAASRGPRPGTSARGRVAPAVGVGGGARSKTPAATARPAIRAKTAAPRPRPPPATARVAPVARGKPGNGASPRVNRTAAQNGSRPLKLSSPAKRAAMGSDDTALPGARKMSINSIIRNAANAKSKGKAMKNLLRGPGGAKGPVDPRRWSSAFGSADGDGTANPARKSVRMSKGLPKTDGAGAATVDADHEDDEEDDDEDDDAVGPDGKRKRRTLKGGIIYDPNWDGTPAWRYDDEDEEYEEVLESDLLKDLDDPLSLRRSSIGGKRRHSSLINSPYARRASQCSDPGVMPGGGGRRRSSIATTTGAAKPARRASVVSAAQPEPTAAASSTVDSSATSPSVPSAAVLAVPRGSIIKDRQEAAQRRKGSDTSKGSPKVPVRPSVTSAVSAEAGQDGDDDDDDEDDEDQGAGTASIKGATKGSKPVRKGLISDKEMAAILAQHDDSGSVPQRSGVPRYSITSLVGGAAKPTRKPKQFQEILGNLNTNTNTAAPTSPSDTKSSLPVVSEPVPASATDAPSASEVPQDSQADSTAIQASTADVPASLVAVDGQT